MTAAELLGELRSRDVKLWLEGERLRLNAPKGALTPELQASIVAAKAEILSFLRMAQAASEGGAPPIRPMPRDGSIPVSFGQQRLWFVHQLDPGSPAYNIHQTLPLPSELDLSLVERVFNEIVRRHEILRTTFAIVQGEPVQVIAPSLTLKVPVVDLRTLPEAQRKRESELLRRQEASRPFDLGRGPLMRVMVLHVGEPEAEYELLVTQHHIVTDGWSVAVLFQEFLALYAAFAAGAPSPLPEPPVQYADYAIWQRRWLQGEVLERQVSYWRRALAGLPVLDLPSDRPRPPVQTFRGALQLLALSGDLTESLKALARAEGATLFMTLLAAFDVLLAGYAGQDDIVVGTSNGNRSRTEIEKALGFFVNTQVLRTDLGGDPSFRELLARVKQVTLEAHAHADLPFEKLVEELHPARDLSRSPLFQVFFIGQNTPLESMVKRSPAELRTKRGEVFDGVASMFDLTFSFIELGGGVCASLDYNTDLFDHDTITSVLDRFLALLQRVVADPGRRLSELPLMSAAEHALVLAWNDTRRAEPPNGTLHALFEAQVARTPDAVALVGTQGSMSFDQLNRRANRLAHRLRGLGVGRESRVGIYLTRSLEAWVALLGTLKAGGAWVPIDPSYPPDRIALMLGDAAPAVVVTTHALRPTLPPCPAGIVCLNDSEASTALTEADPEHLTTCDDAAYVIYTSGSTGRPKGVVALHRAALNRFQWMWDTYPFEADEVCCQKTALSFVDSVWEIFGPLLKGVPVLAVPDELRDDPERLVDALAAHGVTRLVLVPSLLRVLLDSGIDLRARLPRLKYWVSSGEALPADLLRRFKEALPAAVLLNLYGSSEVAADATCHDTAAWEWPRPVPIGRPIDNMRAWVLDARGRLAPIGIPGELYVGGAGLARCYWNRPDLTAERFVPDPFGDAPGARLYRTGDRARLRPDGAIEYLGRSDHQVKLRGFRIELGEIEAALGERGDLSDVVVVAREERPGESRLVAYLVPTQEAPSASELRAFLAERLPEFMIPSVFVILPALPLTPNGKVDRRALPPPDSARPDVEAAYVTPRNALETSIAAIWCEVLGLERVGVFDNFFDLGGHSLLLVRVHGRLKGLGSQEISIVEMFQYPTVDALARRLAGEGPGAGAFDAAQQRASRQREARRQHDRERADGVAP